MSATDSGITIPGHHTMAPQQRLTVTLEAQQWDVIMRVMAKSPIPYEVVAPLIMAIRQQCMASGAPPSNVAQLHEAGR